MSGRLVALRWAPALALVGGLAAAPSAAPAQSTHVAVHQKEITPQIGVPLAGYGGMRRRNFPDLLDLYEHAFYLKPSQGVHDPIHAKVLMLQEGSETLVLVALDLVGIEAGLRDEVLDGISGYGFDPDAVLLSATHTHSGPGAIFRNEFAEFVGADRHEKAVSRRLVAGVVEAIDESVALLVPGSLETASFPAPGLQRHRVRPALCLPDCYVDETANLMLVKNGSGAYLGAAIHFAIHGTALGEENLHYSGDAPAAIAAAFGRELGARNGPLSGDTTPVPVLFLNGAEGDVAPRGSGPAGMSAVAADFTLEARNHLAATKALPNPSWTVKATDVDLKTPLKYLGPFGGDPADPRLGLDLSSWLPSEVRIVSVELGHLRLLSWPGEATSKIGRELRNLCSAGAGAEIWLLGMTNQHLGYFTTPEEFATGTYEAQNSMYGPSAGRKLIKEHCKLLAQP